MNITRLPGNRTWKVASVLCLATKLGAALAHDPYSNGMHVPIYWHSAEAL